MVYDLCAIHGINGEICYIGGSFHKKCFRVSTRWEIHHATLCTPISAFEKFIVKACRDADRCHEECTGEVRKMDLVDLVLRQSPKLHKTFAVADTYETTVTKDSGFFGSKKKGEHRTVHDGTAVVVQERHDGQIQTLLDIEVETNSCWEPRSRSPFHDLILEVYNVTGGRYVIAAIKGVNLEGCHVMRSDGRGYGSAKYLITSLRVHSVDQELGSQDKGMAGIKAFLKSAGAAVPTEPLASNKDFAEKLRTRRERKESTDETRGVRSSSFGSASYYGSSSWTFRGRSLSSPPDPSFSSSPCQCKEHGCNRCFSSPSSSSSYTDTAKVEEDDLFLNLLGQVLHPPEMHPTTWSHHSPQGRRYSEDYEYDRPGHHH